MIANLTVMSESPSGGDVFFRGSQIAFGEMHPSQGIPVSDERGDERQFLLCEAIERDIAESGGRGRNCRLGVLLRFIQVRLLQRKLVGDVIPYERRSRKLDGMVEGGQRFVVLAKIQVGVAQADL